MNFILVIGVRKRRNPHLVTLNLKYGTAPAFPKNSSHRQTQYNRNLLLGLSCFSRYIYRICSLRTAKKFIKMSTRMLLFSFSDT